MSEELPFVKPANIHSIKKTFTEEKLDNLIKKKLIEKSEAELEEFVSPILVREKSFGFGSHLILWDQMKCGGKVTKDYFKGMDLWLYLSCVFDHVFVDVLEVSAVAGNPWDKKTFDHVQQIEKTLNVIMLLEMQSFQ